MSRTPIEIGLRRQGYPHLRAKYNGRPHLKQASGEKAGPAAGGAVEEGPGAGRAAGPDGGRAQGDGQGQGISLNMTKQEMRKVV